MAKKEGSASDIIRTFQRKIDPTPLDTGNFVLNAALGNGLPRNSIIELASDSGLGKSTIAVSICRSLCSQGKKVIYIDAEGGMEDPTRFTKEEYKVGNLLYDMKMEPYIKNGQFVLLNNINVVDDVNTVLTSLINLEEKGGVRPEPDYMFVVVDSISALMNANKMINKNGGIEEQQMGDHAKIVQRLIKRINLFKNAGVTFLFINQLRVDIGSLYNTKHTTGGASVEYYPDIRFRLAKDVDIKNAAGIKIGSWIKITAEKNRMAKGKLPYRVPIIFGKGMSQLLAVLELMKTKKIVNYNGDAVPMYQEGSWKVLTLGNKPEDIYKSQQEAQLLAVVRKEYDNIINNKLITQDDFKISVDLGEVLGEGYE